MTKLKNLGHLLIGFYLGQLVQLEIPYAMHKWVWAFAISLSATEAISLISIPHPT
jgi:hypothetical protein